MARRFQTQYKMKSGTDLGAADTWDRRFDDIDRRIDFVETGLSDVDDVAARIEGVALDRINNIVTPLVRETIARVRTIPTLFTATSTSTVALGATSATFVIDASQRNTFAALAYAQATVNGSPDKSIIGRVVSYNSDTGALVLTPLQTSGTGSFSDWVITLSAPPDLLHAARTDNPHSTTAEQVGAYTKGAVDNLVTTSLANYPTKADQTKAISDATYTKSAVDNKFTNVGTAIDAVNLQTNNRVSFTDDQNLSDAQLLRARRNLRAFPSNLIGLNASTVLSNSSQGVQYVVSNADANQITITLPAVSSMRVGDVIGFNNVNGLGVVPVVINKAASDSQYAIQGGSGFSLRPGETARLITNGVSWYFVDWTVYPNSVLNFDSAQNLSADQISRAFSNLKVYDFMKSFLGSALAADARSVLGAQTVLGFTPVQQGGGTGQANSKVFIGNVNGQPNIQQDNVNYGKIWNDLSSTFRVPGGGKSYYALPNGLMFNTVRANVSGDTYFSWASAFPNQVLYVAGNIERGDDTPSSMFSAHIDQTSNNGAAIRIRYTGGGTPSPNFTALGNILAIGY